MLLCLDIAVILVIAPPGALLINSKNMYLVSSAGGHPFRTLVRLSGSSGTWVL